METGAFFMRTVELRQNIVKIMLDMLDVANYNESRLVDTNYIF
jgi:hypothetical protein